MSEHLSDELLSAHHDGALGQGELEAARVHLLGCGECSRRLDLLSATSRAVAALPGEQPRPLDFSFLPAVPATVIALPRSRGWRPPRWAPTALAAAAVLVLAAGVGSLGLRLPASNAGSSASLGSGIPRHGPTGPAGGSVATGDGAGAAVNGSSAAAPPTTTSNLAPLRGSVASGPTSQRSFPAAGGAEVSLSASSASSRRGEPVQVSILVHAGSTSLDTRGLRLTVRRGDQRTVVLGAGAQSIPPGRSATIFGPWVAGRVEGGPPAAGEYRLDAEVLLDDGSQLVVSLVVHVT